jgi:hypothetical protein
MTGSDTYAFVYCVLGGGLDTGALVSCIARAGCDTYASVYCLPGGGLDTYAYDYCIDDFIYDFLLIPCETLFFRQTFEMTPPKERHLADREWVGGATPFLKTSHDVINVFYDIDVVVSCSDDFVYDFLKTDQSRM